VPGRYVAVALILAAVAVVVGVGLPLLGSGASDGNPVAGGQSSAAGGSVTPPGASATPTIGVVVTAPAAGPTPAGPSRSAFTPLVLEAEDVPSPHRRGTKLENLYPSDPPGNGVSFDRHSGKLQFQNLAVPAAGTYRVTIVYDPHDDRSRTGRINGTSFTFAQGQDCCLQVTVDVSISPGGTVTIEPTNWRGGRPAIDRILIDQI
jgi:hypothetical protein